jgi:pyruvate kinase
VEAIVVDDFTSIDDVLERTPKILIDGQLAAPGSHVLLTTGTTFGISGTTNTIMVLHI